MKTCKIKNARIEIIKNNVNIKTQKTQVKI